MWIPTGCNADPDPLYTDPDSEGQKLPERKTKIAYKPNLEIQDLFYGLHYMNFLK